MTNEELVAANEQQIEAKAQAEKNIKKKSTAGRTHYVRPAPDRPRRKSPCGHVRRS